MKNNKDSVVLKWIAQVCGTSLWWMALLVVIRVLQGASCIVYAYALGQVVDSAQAGFSDAFSRQLSLFVVLVVITLILQASGRYVHEKAKALLDKKFRVHTFSQLLQGDYGQVTRVHTGEWMNRITSDTNVVSVAVASIVPDLASALVRMIGAFIALLQLVPQIAFILVPAGLVLTFFSYFIRKWLKQLHKTMQQADGRARSYMQERLYSLLVVRTFTQEQATERMASECMDDYVGARMRKFHFTNMSFTVLAIAINGAQVLGIGLCGWGILTGAMSYGTMSSVLYLINLLETPLAGISGYFSQYSSMLASAERLMEIDALKPDTVTLPVSQDTVHQYYDKGFASLGLDNVTFSYEEGEENIVLENFSMQIRKGAFVAFTGESGCGKSTAMKLLLGLYPFSCGTAYLCDMAGNRQPLDAQWRGLFAYVPQGNQLISGTIRETLTFSDKELMAQEERLQEALKIACADGFVKELPDGLDAVIGERGSGLSEGQMQRLSVARAVLSGRPILLLDEATSALDAATEKQLLENLRSMTDRTVLIITHREAAIDICDDQIHFEKTP